MTEPLTKEERERGQRWADMTPEGSTYQYWLRGYEALVVQLEKKIGLLFLEREDIKAQLEARLKIAGEALARIPLELIHATGYGHALDIANNSLAAMNAVGKGDKRAPDTREATHAAR